jgi:hypothetical protein
MPVAGELATVDPVMAQVSEVTEQLSAVIGLGVMIEAVHTPVSEERIIFEEHVIVGF